MPEFSVPTQLPDWIKDHVKRYLDSGGADGHMWDSTFAGGPGPIPTLLLATTGRRSGKSHTTPLIYSKADDGGFVVVASRGGTPDHPDWYKNLVADPNVSIRVATEVFDATARTASPQERAVLWKRMAEIYPPYDAYQSRAEREIPVVILAPVT
jgi:deazaflavin-dependent oxidoreductase (nitroreductase family)